MNRDKLCDYHIRREIDSRENVVIRHVRELVDGCDFSNQNKPPSSSQINNLQRVATSNAQVERVIAWLHYQMGRSGSAGETWTRADFGKKLEQSLRGPNRSSSQRSMFDLADGVLHQVKGTCGDLREVDREYVQMELVKLFIGHLRWYLTYYRKRHGIDNDAREDA